MVKALELAGFRVRFDFDAVTKTLGQPAASEARKQEAQALLDRLFGKDGLVIQVASKDGLCALVVGGDEAALQSVLARLTSKSEAPPIVAHALAEVGDLNPCFVLRYDLGNLMKGMQELVPGAASLFQAVPLTLLVWGGVDGPVWRGGIASSLSEIRSLAQSPPKPKPRGPASARADITSIVTALTEYAINNSGHYPEDLEPLVTPDANGHKYLEWPGEGIPKDPWGREYIYEAPREGHPRPRVTTLGRDGQLGGTGEDADLDSDKL